MGELEGRGGFFCAPRFEVGFLNTCKVPYAGVNDFFGTKEVN